MAVLIDFSQIYMSNVMRMALTKGAKGKIDVDLARHNILNSLRIYNERFRDQYGEMILVCDSDTYWRKTLFPHYKASRKDTRSKTAVDWKTIFALLDELKTDLSKYFPYKVIETQDSEADDVIATLAKHLSKTEKVMIVSRDHDFVQLQQYSQIEQFDPIMKKPIVESDPKKALLEHILGGDKGDGIPNVLSDDDTFVNANKRQEKLMQTFVDGIVDSPTAYFNPDDLFTDTNTKRNFQRNKMLIDLDQIPIEITEKIMVDYQNACNKPKDRGRIMSYMIKHKMKNLMGCINDF